MRFLVHGDFHGTYDSIYERPELHNPKTAIICLGDFSVNYFQDESDERRKRRLNSLGCIFYVVRGNHEMRPEHLPNTIDVYDMNVLGKIWMEPAFPNIRYMIDGEEYNINGKSTLVIGGAYSVDKWIRLEHGWPWFEDEQLSAKERNNILEKVKGKKYDVLLSHTCPFRFQPTFLFISSVNQALVDNSMELFMDRVWEETEINSCYFGHYHGDYEITDNIYLCYEELYEWN